MDLIRTVKQNIAEFKGLSVRLLFNIRRFRVFDISILTFLLISTLPIIFPIGVVDLGHFFSSMSVFDYAFTNSMQFGVDLIDNVGPYGFLHYPWIYSLNYHFFKLIYWAVLVCLYSYSALLIVHQLDNKTAQIIFCFAALIAPINISFPWYSYEIIPRLTTLFLALSLVSNKHDKLTLHSIFHPFLCGVTFGLLSLVKTSQFYLCLIITMILILFWISRRQYNKLSVFCFGFLFAFVALWKIANQDLANIIIFFKSSNIFTSAYSSALGEKLETYAFLIISFLLILGIALISGRMGFGVPILIRSKKLPAEWIRNVLVAVVLLISWKHGIQRGMASFGTFAYIVPVLLTTLLLMPLNQEGTKTIEASEVREKINWYNHLRAAVTGLLLVGFIFAINSTFPSPAWQTSLNPVSVLQDRIRFTSSHINSSLFQKLKIQHTNFINENKLPEKFLEKIGNSTIDFFGDEPGILLYNELNYLPRPMPMRSIITTAELKKINGDFYRNKKTAPEFVLMKHFARPELDSVTLMSLFVNYETIEYSTSYTLLKKRKDFSQFDISLLRTKSARLGDWKRIEPLTDSALWLETNIEKTILGYLFHALIRAPLVNLDFRTVQGKKFNHQVSIDALNSGFPLISLETLNSTLGLDGDKISEWQVSAVQRDMEYFKHDFDYKIYKLEKWGIEANEKKELSMISLMSSLVRPLSSELPFDFFKSHDRSNISSKGISSKKCNGTECWRWAEGPSTEIIITSAHSKEIKVRLIGSLKNSFVPDQEVYFKLNNETLKSLSPSELKPEVLNYFNIPLTLHQGFNRVTLNYGDWNRGSKIFAPHDPRKLAVVIMSLRIEADH